MQNLLKLNPLTLKKRPLFIAVGTVIALSVIAAFAVTTFGQVAEIPDHLRLKSTKDRLLGVLDYQNGDVKYAYRSDVRVSNAPTPEIIKEAQKNGLQATQEILSKRTKHARTFNTNKNGMFVTEIISGVPQYYLDDNGAWWHAEYGTTTREAYDEQTKPNIIARLLFPKARATVTDFLPDPDPETNTVDGRTQRDVSPESFTSLRAGNGTAANDSETSNIVVRLEGASTNYASMFLSIFLFDTSSLPDTDTITSATFSVQGTSKAENAGFGLSVVLTNSNPNSNTAVVAADFDDHTTQMATELGSSRITFASWSTAGRNEIGVTSPDSNISKTGITKMGLTSSADFDNSEPTHAVGIDNVNGDYSETTGTSNDPKLSVTHGFVIDTEARKPSNLEREISYFTTDDDLELSLEANKTYNVDGVLFVASSSTIPDFKFRFGLPASSTMRIGYIPDDGGGALMTNSTTSSDRIQISKTDPEVISIHGTLKMDSSQGKLQFSWAQYATSSGNPVYLYEGSYIRAEEIP